MGSTDNYIILFQIVIRASKEIKQVTQLSYYAGDTVWGLTSLKHKKGFESPF